MAITRYDMRVIIGLQQALQDLQNDIDSGVLTLEGQIGDLGLLQVPAVTNVVDALNALYALSGNALQADNNLSDLTDVAAARVALDVLSTTEVQTLVDDAKLALGTNYTVDTIAERDALANLDLDDRVHVRDSGTGEWATYKPTAIDPETGLVTDWMMLMSQSIMQNAMSAAAIKQAYESNPDTNAFTDAEKAKLEGLSQASTPVTENLVIAGSDITLTTAPQGGIAGILNFGTVRYLDSNGATWDATVVATADPAVFTVETDVAGEWDTQTVQIQYVPAQV